jgi:hypothetical protein
MNILVFGGKFDRNRDRPIKKTIGDASAVGKSTPPPLRAAEGPSRLQESDPFDTAIGNVRFVDADYENST